MGNYLGRGLDRISNIEIMDNLVFDGSSSYSITKNSVAFAPNSSQSCLLSIDGVVQAGNFTVNSSTIDFGVAIPSTSVCNFFLHYGTGLITVPSDGSVTESKIGSNAVTSAKMFSGFANGITMADFWYFNATQSISANTSTTLTNWSRNPLDSTTGTIGLNMSESSGIFTFPQTGIYNISSSIEFLSTSTSSYRYVQGQILTTLDNSTYITRSIATSSIGTGINSSFANVNINYIMDVPDTSNYKLKINAQMVLAGEIYRNAGNARTNVIFTRIGDT